MEELIFGIGTIGFWTLILLASFILFALIEYERGIWPLIVFIAVAALINYFGDFNVLSWIVKHPVWAVLGFFGWFGIGTLWCFAKWYFYCKSLDRRHKEARLVFQKERDLKGDIPENLMLEWNNFLQSYCRFDFWGHYTGHFLKPIVQENKRRICIWITYWPWSLIWTVINDPIKRLVKNIYYQIESVLQRISDKIFADAKDILSAEELQQRNDKANEQERNVLGTRLR